MSEDEAVPYQDIVRHLPADAQQRILMYAESVEEEETPESLAEMYGVKDVREVVQHLAEYESGTAYPFEDKLVRDYTMFWQAVGKVWNGHEGG